VGIGLVPPPQWIQAPIFFLKETKLVGRNSTLHWRIVLPFLFLVLFLHASRLGRNIETPHVLKSYNYWRIDETATGVGPVVLFPFYTTYRDLPYAFGKGKAGDASFRNLNSRQSEVRNVLESR